MRLPSLTPIGYRSGGFVRGDIPGIHKTLVQMNTFQFYPNLDQESTRPNNRIFFALIIITSYTLLSPRHNKHNV